MTAVSLGDVCRVIGGGTPSKSRADFYRGSIPWASIRDMQGDWLEKTEFRITPEAVAESATNIIPAGSVLMASRVGLGKATRIRHDTAINQDIRAVIPNDDKTLDKQYLFYWFKSIADEIEAAGQGATVKGVTLPFIKGLQIPLPPLPEQHRIVAILDEAFADIATAKANAENNLQNTRSLFEMYLHSVFTRHGTGWARKKLGDIFEIGSSKRIRENEWTSSGVPFYGGKEIVNLAKSGSVVSNSYISEGKYRDYASKYDMPRQGDILITARGTIGVGYVVQEGDKFYYKDGNIISMRGKVPVNPHYFLYAFRSSAIADQLGDLTGTTVRHLPIEKAKEIVLWMPDFANQNMIVSEVQRVEGESQNLESLYTRKLAALDELKQSLLQQAFSGAL